ncbi:MAG TPA: helix-turn-helix transcriptional regulator [Pseudonocardiaceae bacterium]|nr:helix-turn-helix transcriptional regulator [Pseudonocardiaceae bacterium]
MLLGLREGTGLNQTEFGVRAGMNQSKVSRLETARQVPTRAQAEAWARAAGASNEVREQLLEKVEAALTETTSWADEVRKGVATKQRYISDEERSATISREFAVIVPGLLQTAEYTRRLFYMQAALQPKLFPDVLAGLAAWAERQQVLFEPGRQFQFVVPEAALRWRPGPEDNPRLLATQLRHIISVSRLDTVRFGVIPWNRAVQVCPMHGFVMRGVPEVDEDVEVSIYTTTRELRIRDEAQIGVYMELWGKLCEDAVFGEDARELLRSLAREFLIE